MQQSPAVAQLINEGLAAHQSGDIEGARQLFQRAVDIDAQDPEALQLLGLMYELQKDRDRALTYIGKAVEIDPNEPLFRMNLASVLEKLRRFDEALEHVDHALKLKPNASDIWNLRGNIELANQQVEQASLSYKKAYQTDQQNIDALAGYGQAKFMTGDLREADRVLRTALASSPVNTVALTLALQFAQRERNDRAVNAIAEQWKKAHAKNPDSIRKLAYLLHIYGYNAAAEAAFRIIIESVPENYNDLVQYGRYCTATQKFDVAKEVLTKAINFDPSPPDATLALSRLEYYLGNLKEAEKLCLAALVKQPNNPTALMHLCDLKKGKLEQEHIDEIHEILTAGAAAKEDLYKLHMALGNIFHTQSSYKEAFETFQKGNTLGLNQAKQHGNQYQPKAAREKTKSLISFFNKSACLQKASPISTIPIFIIGTPRSGTTLLESILSTHPEVYGVGEPPSMPSVLQDVLLWANNAQAISLTDAPYEKLLEWRNLYFGYTTYPEGAKYIVDKQTLNFESVGLIHTLFPEAKIIHIRRNPVETCFSIFRQAFNPGWTFTYKLADIACFYAQYARLASHWESLLQEDFPLFQYETLITDFELETQRLFSHCSLEWSEEVLNFHQQKRPVLTFSSAQVREPITKSPKNSADFYERLLDPLRDALEEEKIDLETGALIA